MARPREYSDDYIFKGVHLALGKYGYAKLTLDNIAQEINLSPAALSKRFGSKKKLLLFYIDTVIDKTQAAFDACRALPGPSLPILKSLLIQSLGQVQDAETLANVTSLFIECVSDSDLLERSKTRLRIIDEGIRHFTSAAITNGEMVNLDPEKAEAINRVLQAAIAGSLMIWLNDETQTLESWLDDCFTAILGPCLPPARNINSI